MLKTCEEANPPVAVFSKRTWGIYYRDYLQSVDSLARLVLILTGMNEPHIEVNDRYGGHRGTGRQNYGLMHKKGIEVRSIIFLTPPFLLQWVNYEKR